MYYNYLYKFLRGISIAKKKEAENGNAAIHVYVFHSAEKIFKYI